jgi:hypothetical protein
VEYAKARSLAAYNWAVKAKPELVFGDMPITKSCSKLSDSRWSNPEFSDVSKSNSRCCAHVFFSRECVLYSTAKKDFWGIFKCTNALCKKNEPFFAIDLDTHYTNLESHAKRCRGAKAYEEGLATFRTATKADEKAMQQVMQNYFTTVRCAFFQHRLPFLQACVLIGAHSTHLGDGKGQSSLHLTS